MLVAAGQFSDNFDKFSDKADWARMHGMMGFGPYGGFPSVAVLLWLATWVLVVMVLIALFRWLWRKGGR